MKLDLLYEFQPKIKPWDEPHPYGQRKAEQARYDEAIAEIQLRRHARLPDGVVRRAPLPRRPLGVPVQRGRARRARPGHREHPPRLRRRAHAARVPAPGARRREGRRPSTCSRHGRVEWGTGRSTPMEQIAFGVPADDRVAPQWREAVEFVVEACGSKSASPGTARPDPVPRAHADAQAVPGPAPAGVARRRQRRHRRSAPGATASACCRSPCCSRSR